MTLAITISSTTIIEYYFFVGWLFLLHLSFGPLVLGILCDQFFLFAFSGGSILSLGFSLFLGLNLLNMYVYIYISHLPLSSCGI